MSSAVTHRIGDLCEQVRGVTYSKADAVLSPKAGFKPVLRANNITERGLTFENLVYVPAGRIAAKQFVRQNDVVVAASSGSIDVVGKAARAPGDFDGGFGAFCKVLRPNGKVDPGYFAHFFQTQGYRRRVSGLAAGANINNLRNEHLDDLEVALPPLAEQRRIAAILDKADALRAKRREALAKLDQLLQSVFLDMFGDPLSNPMGWPEYPLGQIASSTKIGLVRSAEEFGDDFEVPYVRMDAVSADGKFLAEKVKKTNVDDSELRDYALEPGDLLFNTRNSKELVGKTCIYTGPRGWTFNNNLMRIRFKDGICSPVIAIQFQFSRVKHELEKRKSGTTSVFAVYWRELQSLPLLIPPMEKQNQFAEIAKEIEAKKQSMKDATTRLDSLFISLQNHAFARAI